MSYSGLPLSISITYSQTVMSVPPISMMLSIVNPSRDICSGLLEIEDFESFMNLSDEPKCHTL